MTPPLDELYLEWLYSQVAAVSLKNPRRTYWSLAKQLYTKEFVWFVPNDDNRAEDGRDLRREFVEKKGLTNVDPEWMELGCSMLEMLIALSRWLSFEAEGEPRDWFWAMLENLGLQDHSDALHFDPDEVDEILNTVIWRTYSPDGRGGLFPLLAPKTDQRDVEIWYQLNAYVMEMA